MIDINEKRDQRRKMMLEDNLFKVIPIVAMPMVLSMMVDGIYNLADTYFVSQLGISATAAVGVNDAILQIFRAIAMGFGMGASSYISRLMGAKQEDEASKVATTTIITSVLVMAAVGAIIFCFVDKLVMAMGATETSKQYAIDYASFIILSAPFTACETSCNNILRAEGSTTNSMIGMISGCAINCILDPIFINVIGLGVAGAALATTISKFISAMVLLIPFLRHRTLVEFKFSNFAPKWQTYKEIARMGLPSVIRIGLFSLSGVVTNRIAGTFSDAVLAAVSVGNKIIRLSGSAIIGFGQGFQPVTGYCYGAKKYKRVRDAFWSCTIIGCSAAVLIGLLIYIFCPTVITAFVNGSSGADTVRVGTMLVRTQCFTMIAHMWIVIVNGLFLATGKPTQATILDISRQVVFFLPCLIILSRLFGETGLACSQSVADILSLIIALCMLIREMRILRKMPDGDETIFDPE